MIEPDELESAVNIPCDVQLEIPGLNLPENLPNLNATLKRFGSSKEEPFKPNDDFSVSLFPKSPGEYL